MGRVSNHAKMKMHLANVVLGDEKQSTPCIMAARSLDSPQPLTRRASRVDLSLRER